MLKNIIISLSLLTAATAHASNAKPVSMSVAGGGTNITVTDSEPVAVACGFTCVLNVGASSSYAMCSTKVATGLVAYKHGSAPVTQELFVDDCVINVTVGQ